MTKMARSHEEGTLRNAIMVSSPTLNDLRQISDEYNLKVTDEKLNYFLGTIERDLDTLNALKAWENPLHGSHLCEDRNFYRATPQENQYNAWYYKCEIQGVIDDERLQLLKNKKLAIKDNIFIRNVPLMDGSKTLEGYIPEFDATVIERILNHGGTIIGNTTCENLCLSGASYNTTYGPVRNPWNPEYSAGGSSSGSGVVIASCEADMALGGDQGGSIRIPSSSCGIVGLKPTFGLVPYTGIIPIVHALDHVGPMARNVTDCARLLTAIAGFDDKKDDRQPSCGFKSTNYLTELESTQSGVLRIGVLKEGFEMCDEEVNSCIRHAVDLIKSSNKFLQIEDVSIPDHSKALIPFSAILYHSTQAQLIDGCGYGTGMRGLLSCNLPGKLYDGLKLHAHTLHDFGKQVILSAAYVKKHGGDTVYSSYAKAQTWFWLIGKAYDEALKEFDVLLMPTLPKLPEKIPPPEAGITEVMEGAVNMIKNTAPFDVTHHPAITLNAGFDEKTNMPIGLQLVGRLWDDATVLKAAKLVEEALEEQQKPFNISK